MNATDLEKLSEEELQALVLEHYPTAKRSREDYHAAIFYRIVAGAKEWPLERFSKDAWFAAAREITGC